MLIVAWSVAALLTLPMLWFALECLAAGLARAIQVAPEAPPIDVLIPAHDEADAIFRVVSRIRQGLRPCDRVLVVADNCTDDTAELARQAGADVIERTNPDRRGKSYALAFGRDHLRQTGTAHPVIVVIDADCVPVGDAVQRIASVAAARQATVQGCYLLVPTQSAPPSTRVSAFAFLVKNLIRQKGLQALSGRCLLQGSGMAIPWSRFDQADLDDASLVEDLRLGLNLALDGAPLCFVADALFVSPTGAASGVRSQRIRWEHGMIATACVYLPRLIRRGLATPRLLAVAADLLVPPLVLLCLLTAVGVAPVSAGSLVTGSIGPMLLLLSGCLTFAVAVSTCWYRHGRELLPAAMLMALVSYGTGKLPIYARLAFKRQRAWVRTERVGMDK